MAIREAYRVKDMNRFNELQLEMKKMKAEGAIPTLSMPKSRDPMTFYHDQQVLNYKRLKSEAIREGNKNNLKF